MYTISKQFDFSASHNLYNLPEHHPCTKIHGHNYILTVYLSSEVLNNSGFVVDYHSLKPIKKWIDKNLDHENLNDVFDFSPTVELMCKFIYDKFKVDFPSLRAIEMSETPKTNCRYEP